MAGDGAVNVPVPNSTFLQRKPIGFALPETYPEETMDSGGGNADAPCYQVRDYLQEWGAKNVVKSIWGWRDV